MHFQANRRCRSAGSSALFRHKLARALGLAALAATWVANGYCRAATVAVVVPNALANTEGDANNAFPFFSQGQPSSQRFQQVYASSQFSLVAGQSGLITQIAFRRDGASPTYSTSLFDIQINMSTTSKAPDGLSSTFSSNVGANDTIVVARGTYPISSTSTTSPRAFDIIINLTTPFRYDPSAGNLLMDIRNFNMNANAQAFDATSVLGDSVSRVFSSIDNNVTTLTGNADTTGLPTNFTFTVPEPSLGLFSIAATVLVPMARRRRRSR